MSKPGHDSESTPANGVKVIVHHRPALEASDEPEPREREPRAIIMPPGLSAAERDAFLGGLCKEYRGFIEGKLRRRRDVVAESVKDLCQEALVILCRRVEDTTQEPLEHPKAYLAGIIRNLVPRHNASKPDVNPEADADARPCSDPNPEAVAGFAERRDKLRRYLEADLAVLTPEEAEVVRAMDQHGRSLEETAAQLGRPRSTVARQHARAWQKLEDRARASAEATRYGHDR